MSDYRIVRCQLVETKKDGTPVARPFYGIRFSVPSVTGNIYVDTIIDAEDADLSGIRQGDVISGDFDISKSQSEPDANGKVWDNFNAYAKPGSDIAFRKAARPKVTVA